MLTVSSNATRSLFLFLFLLLPFCGTHSLHTYTRTHTFTQTVFVSFFCRRSMQIQNIFTKVMTWKKKRWHKTALTRQRKWLLCHCFVWKLIMFLFFILFYVRLSELNIACVYARACVCVCMGVSARMRVRMYVFVCVIITLNIVYVFEIISNVNCFVLIVC